MPLPAFLDLADCGDELMCNETTFYKLMRGLALEHRRVLERCHTAEAALDVSLRENQHEAHRDACTPPREGRVLCPDALHCAKVLDVEQLTNLGANGTTDGRPSQERGRTNSRDTTSSRPLSQSMITKARKSITEAVRRKSVHSSNDFQAVRQKCLFLGEDGMKELVRMKLHTKEYKVEDLYKDVGWAQHIVRNSLFHTFSLGVVIANTIWIGVDSDYNQAEVVNDAATVFLLVEQLFCFLFFFEITVRFAAFQYTKDALNNRSFDFDLVLVLAMVIETWILPLILLMISSATQSTWTSSWGNGNILRCARILRLTRVARIVRFLRATPEIVVLMKGLLASIRTMFFTLMLLVTSMYVFALAFVNITRGTAAGENYFKTIPRAMMTLTVYGTLLDECSEVIHDLEKDGVVYVVMFLAYIALAALTLLNMLIGVLCEVVAAVAAREREDLAVKWLKEGMWPIFQRLDVDGNGTISLREFDEMFTMQDAVEILTEFGVDVVGLISLREYFFSDDSKPRLTVATTSGCLNQPYSTGSLSYGDFLEKLMKLRGTNKATVADTTLIFKYMIKGQESLTAALNSKYARIENIVSEVLNQLRSNECS